MQIVFGNSSLQPLQIISDSMKKDGTPHKYHVTITLSPKLYAVGENSGLTNDVLQLSHSPNNIDSMGALAISMHSFLIGLTGSEITFRMLQFDWYGPLWANVINIANINSAPIADANPVPMSIEFVRLD